MDRYCHVWSLQTEEHVSFRLTSIDYLFFVVGGTRVALLFGNSVTVRDTSVNTTRTISTSPSMVFMTLTASHLITTHLYDKSTASYPASVRVNDAQLEVVRHPLSDLNSSKEYLSLRPHVYYSNDVLVDELSLELMNDSPSGEYMQWSNNRAEGLEVRQSMRGATSSKRYPQPKAMLVSYDYGNDRLHLRVDREFVSWNTVPVAPNVAYNLYKIIDGNCRIIVTDPYVDSSLAILSPMSGARRSPFFVYEADWIVLDRLPMSIAYRSPFLVYGDADFILVLGTSGLKVWCFDESICPPGAVRLPTDAIRNSRKRIRRDL